MTQAMSGDSTPMPANVRDRADRALMFHPVERTGEPIPFKAAGIKTMSSVEIADLTGKRHDNVIRDIKTMLDELGLGALSFEGTYRDSQNKERPCFDLPRRECLILVSGYSVELRARIIDRWEDLERRNAAPAALPDLSDPKVLLGLLSDYANDKIALEGRLAEMAPQVAALDRLARAEGSLCITDAAKALQMRPKDLFSYLGSHGWIYRRPNTSGYLGYQSKVTTGVLEHKVTTVLRADGSEKVNEQVRVTPKGLTRLATLIKRPESVV